MAEVGNSTTPVAENAEATNGSAAPAMRVMSPGAVVRRPLRLDRDRSLKEELFAATGVDVDRCLECGKCSGGCSTGHLFDYTPRKIVQLVKLGAEDRLRRLDALSLCVGCQLCRDRCPAHIDVAAIVDYFRQSAFEHGVLASRPDVEAFNLLFLEGVFTRGRTAELPLMLRFNAGRGRYFDDLTLGRKLLLKGKLRLLPTRVRNKAAVRQLFGAARTALARPFFAGDGGEVGTAVSTTVEVSAAHVAPVGAPANEPEQVEAP